MGEATVDQAAVDQLAAGRNVGNALAGDLPVDGVVDVACRKIDVAGTQDALIGDVAVGMDGERAIGDHFAGVGQALAQGQGEIALRLDLSIAAQVARGEALVAVRAQQPCGIGNRIGTHVQAAARRNLAAGIVERGGHLQIACAVGDDLSLTVVQRLRLQLQLACLQAERVCAVARVAVVYAGCVQGQQAAGSDQAALVVERTCQREVDGLAALYPAASVVQRRCGEGEIACRTQHTRAAVIDTADSYACIALGEHRAAAIVQRAAVHLQTSASQDAAIGA